MNFSLCTSMLYMALFSDSFVIIVFIILCVLDTWVFIYLFVLYLMRNVSNFRAISAFVEFEMSSNNGPDKGGALKKKL